MTDMHVDLTMSHLILQFLREIPDSRIVVERLAGPMNDANIVKAALQLCLITNRERYCRK